MAGSPSLQGYPLVGCERGGTSILISCLGTGNEAQTYSPERAKQLKTQVDLP